MKISKTTGEHVCLPGDRVDYYPQAEATGERFTIIVLPAQDDTPWTGPKAEQAATECERRVRLVAAAEIMLAAVLHSHAHFRLQHNLSPLGNSALKLCQLALDKVRMQMPDVPDAVHLDPVMNLAFWHTQMELFQTQRDMLATALRRCMLHLERTSKTEPALEVARAALSYQDAD